MINATISGNLGRDAELKTVSGGKVLCKFSVASKGRKKDDETEWVTCSLWGPRGQAIAGILTKGTRVVVVGSLRRHEHNGKTYLECDVQDVDFLGGGSKRDEVPAERDVADSYHDESIPF